MGLAMDGFQGGRERTLPRFGIFRKKNVAIFKKPIRERIAGGWNPTFGAQNHRAAVVG
jgi:hypothetical protein